MVIPSHITTPTLQVKKNYFLGRLSLAHHKYRNLSDLCQGVNYRDFKDMTR